MACNVERPEQPYLGRTHQLTRTSNSPQSLRRPPPPILIGGGGERKTLRLVPATQVLQPVRRAELEHKRSAAPPLRDRGPRLRRIRKDGKLPHGRREAG